jgi:hypothetical protein
MKLLIYFTNCGFFEPMTIFTDSGPGDAPIEKVICGSMGPVPKDMPIEEKAVLTFATD